MNFNHSFLIDKFLESKDVIIYYISSPNQAKRTNKAIQIFKNLNINNYDVIDYSDETDFWYGLSENNKACIYLDFDDKKMPIQEFLDITSDEKNFIYDYDLEWTQNNYEHVIITSEKPLNEIYLNIKDPIKSQKFHRLLEKIQNFEIK